MKPQRPYLFDAIYQWILDCGWTPHLLVDTLVEGVEVPLHLIQDDKIVLNIEPNAIAGFSTEEFGILFSARFSGKSEQIIVPYAAMTALFSREQGQGMVFPTEVFKDELSSKAGKPNTLKDIGKSEITRKTVSDTATDNKSKSKKPSLTLIK